MINFGMQQEVKNDHFLELKPNNNELLTYLLTYPVNFYGSRFHKVGR